MLEFFPKIDYRLGGQTLQFTDLFKSIELNTEGFSDYSFTKNIEGKYPEQLAYNLYDDSTLYWSLFLMNGVRNPFKQWNQSSISNKQQKDTEYSSKIFQFANLSQYLPGNTLYYSSNATDSYYGVDFSNINIDDIIIFETGEGPFKLRAFGAGQISSSSDCAYPNYGQALIPDNFTFRNAVTKIAAGEHFSAVLDTTGRIWGWGRLSGLNNFDQIGRLYKSRDSGYTLINITQNKLIATKANGWWCYGSGCTGAASYPVAESKFISKIEFTKGNTFSGVILFSDNKVKTYGLTHATSYNGITDVACGENWCLGIDSVAGTCVQFTATGTGVVQSIEAEFNSVAPLSKIFAGVNHAIALDVLGNVVLSGNNSQGQLDLPQERYDFISAGLNHTVGINQDGKMRTAGKVQYDSGTCTGATAYASLLPLDGTFSSVVSGKDHVVCTESGTNKKYIGRVEIVDNQYRRIYAKGFTGPNVSVDITEPSGTVVNILNSSGLGIKKILQHQLLSIDSYGNSPVYVTTPDGFEILDMVGDNATNWKSVYITNYKNAIDNEQFITPNKLNIDVFNTNIAYINSNKVFALKTALENELSTTNKINIKLSEL